MLETSLLLEDVNAYNIIYLYVAVLIIFTRNVSTNGFCARTPLPIVLVATLMYLQSHVQKFHNLQPVHAVASRHTGGGSVRPGVPLINLIF
jgi:hypothetical protein